MSNTTAVLSARQLAWLAKQLPEPKALTGRPALSNQTLLPGVLYVLKTGCQWWQLPSSVCVHHYATCWRRLEFWRRKGAPTTVWRVVLKQLDGEDQLDLSLGATDGSLVQSPAFKSGTGYSGKHHRTGTNVLLVTERSGLPLALHTGKGNRHDLVLVNQAVAKIRVGAKRRLKKLNADKGFDSRKFRRSLRNKGTQANIPERQYTHRRKRGPKPQYDQTAAKFRAFIERTVAWLKSFRKLRYRYERKKSMFSAWLDFGCLVLCLRRVRVLQ